MESETSSTFDERWTRTTTSVVEIIILCLTFAMSALSLWISIRTARKTPQTTKRKFWLPKSILLIRHGESEGNSKEDTYQSTPDPLVPLSERGRAQSRQLGKLLKEQIGDAPVWVYVGYFTQHLPLR